MPMKKKIFAIALVLLLCGSIVPASAIGGSSDDPLISLSYLRNTLKPQLTAAARAALHPPSSTGIHANEQVLMDHARYKQNDKLIAFTGAEIIVFAGNVQFSSEGIVVDGTNGTELAPKTTLKPNTRYITGEDTNATYTVVSPTAVISCNGKVEIVKSDTPDYNAMADALKSLTLLKGSGSGIGNGYNLENQPNRIEGIIMFIRLLGEEDEALSTTSAHPFKDVPAWADSYVAYAYKKGYSNGIGKDKFGAEKKITAKEYVEFIMRALRYSSTSHTNLSTTLEDARKVGVISTKEYDLFNSTTLLRAHAVYISYYALSAPISGQNMTLADKLIADSIFTKAALDNAHALVTTNRLV